MRFWILALMLVLAGCTGPGEVTTDDATTEDATAPAEERGAPGPSQGSEAFGWTMTAGAPGRSPEVGLMSSNGASFAVPADQQALEVTATWTCDTPTCDLTIDLWAPGALADPLDLLTKEATATGQGSGEVVLQVDAPDAGEWVVVAHSDGVTAGVDGTFTWTIA